MLVSSKKFRSALLGTAAVALMGAAGTMAVSKDANAVAYAYSSLQVTNMAVLIDGVIGIGQVGAGTSGGAGFDSFEFNNKALQVQLGATILNSGADITASSTSSGASLNQTQLCLGDCGTFSDNVYNPVPAVGALGNFAVADNHMTNTVLDGSANFGAQAGAQSHGGGTFASGSQLTGSTMNWNFNTGATDGGKEFSLNWDELRHLEIATTLAGEDADTTMTFVIQLVNITAGTTTTLFNLSEINGTSAFADPINTTVFDEDVAGTQTFPGDPVPGNAGALNITSLTAVLNANTNYELRFTFGTSASAVSPIPEPGALALLGAGLLGLGALRYGRRQKVAAA